MKSLENNDPMSLVEGPKNSERKWTLGRKSGVYVSLKGLWQRLKISCATRIKNTKVLKKQNGKNSFIEDFQTHKVLNDTDVSLFKNDPVKTL